MSRRGWREFFDEIRGAPVDKTAWLQTYRVGAGLDREDVVVFGDTDEDAVAAAAAGCSFVAIGSDRGAGPAVRDFDELMPEWGCQDASRR